MPSNVSLVISVINPHVGVLTEQFLKFYFFGAASPTLEESVKIQSETRIKSV